MEKNDCSFFHKPWEATVGRSPTTVWLYPAAAIGYTPAARFNNDLPETMIERVNLWHTERGRSNLEREVMEEKRGQKKQVSAGNERREQGERKHNTTEKKRGGGKSNHTFPKQQSGVSCPGWDTGPSPPDIRTSPGQTQKQMALDRTSGLGSNGWIHKTSTWGLGMGTGEGETTKWA